MVPDELKVFIAESRWVFAKTYADTWPHEYIVQERVDSALFRKLADHIDTCGYMRHFYSKEVIYWDYDGYTYWHMGNIINRCVEADTYHRREMDGRLPRLLLQILPRLVLWCWGLERGIRREKALAIAQILRLFAISNPSGWSYIWTPNSSVTGIR